VFSYVPLTGEMRNAYKILVAKPEGNRTLRRPKHIWEDNIKMDIKEIGYESVDKFKVAHRRI